MKHILIIGHCMLGIHHVFAQNPEKYNGIIIVDHEQAKEQIQAEKQVQQRFIEPITIHAMPKLLDAPYISKNRAQNNNWKPYRNKFNKGRK